MMSVQTPAGGQLQLEPSVVLNSAQEARLNRMSSFYQKLYIFPVKRSSSRTVVVVPERRDPEPDFKLALWCMESGETRRPPHWKLNRQALVA